MKDLFETAREYARTEEALARETAIGMDVHELRKAYISSVGLVAYYTKLEREMTKPRLHLEQIQKLMLQLNAEEILRQADVAQEQGQKIAGTARVPAKPLIELMSVLRLIISRE